MTLVVELLRPEDLLHLTMEGHNLRLDTSDPAAPVLVHEDPAKDAFLVAVFPPQSFAEQALGEVDPPEKSEIAKGAGEYEARMSGPTRLAFRVPPGVIIPFSIDGLLEWSRLEPSLTRIGAIVGQPAIIRSPDVVVPTETQTFIELPYRLFISPGPNARWRGPLGTPPGGGRKVLWHVRLVDVPDGAPAPIRAVYSPDYDADRPPTQNKLSEFVMSLKPYDRNALVRLTSTFNGAGPLLVPDDDLGKPAEARRLLLTTLGGFLDAHGKWPKGPPQFSFESWTHIAALGRDSFVQVTYRGRLFPLMNRATLIKTTERRFEPSPVDGSPVAYLRQFIKILLDEKEVVYAGEPFLHDGREMPLRRIRVNIDVTPKIENPDIPGSPARYIGTTASFEIKLGSEFWPFPCTAFDGAGNAVQFPMGMIFIPEDDIPDNLGQIAAHYRALPEARKLAPANNSKVRLADSGPEVETTTFVAASFLFDADIGRGSAGFLPRLDRVAVRVPSLELLTGSPKPTTIAFTKSYLDNGFDAAAGLFAEIKGGDLDVKFSADQAGGIVRPDLSVRGFSRNFGPIAGDLSKITTGTFDPASAFGKLDAKLFGSLPIQDILGSNALAEAAPKITIERDHPTAPTAVTTRLHWETRTKAKNVGSVAFTPSAGTLLKIDAVLRKKMVRPDEPPSDDSTIDGRLNDFSVELLEVVLIHFEEFRFSSATAKSTTVAVKLRNADPIQFKGALDFVRKLTEIIPPGIFGQSGPRIILRPDAVEVGFNLALPPAALGVFSIRNIAISTSLVLPFLSGRPSLAFAFASREKPFQIAVVILGGGGFVRIEIDTEGVRGVEVMFEFGGMLALDVGVASGSVHILAGIYIGLKGDASELTGYVRVGGEVTVLAIVSVSIEFMLSLSYYFGPKVAKGVARITLSVRIAFISISVSVSVERSFSAGSRHLSIAEAMTPDDWASYAGAFA